MTQETPKPTIYMDDCGTWSNQHFEDMDGVHTYVRKDPATVAVPVEVVERIASAMTIAKATIKIWHDMGLKKYDPSFEIYDRNSPEMKTINAAITALQPYTKGEK